MRGEGLALLFAEIRDTSPRGSQTRSGSTIWTNAASGTIKDAEFDAIENEIG